MALSPLNLSLLVDAALDQLDNTRRVPCSSSQCFRGYILQ